MKTTECLESVADFKVSFDGRKSIDAKVFTKVIDDMIVLVKESANAINQNSFILFDKIL